MRGEIIECDRLGCGKHFWIPDDEVLNPPCGWILVAWYDDSSGQDVRQELHFCGMAHLGEYMAPDYPSPKTQEEEHGTQEG